jgi:hypothetical protein
MQINIQPVAPFKFSKRLQATVSALSETAQITHNRNQDCAPKDLGKTS